MKVRVLDASPDRAYTPPGEVANLRLELKNSGQLIQGELRGCLLDRGVEQAAGHLSVIIPPGPSTLLIPVTTPAQDARGYQARLELHLDDGTRLEANTAVLVVSHWRLAPRYGFLSDFPADDFGLDKIRELAKFHVTVVQFYDWMYRHYQFLPPEDTFTDAMGRQLSLNTVKARVQGCHDSGMAALAYGAVYGAESEFISNYPDWILRDATGKPLSLIDLFYITDLRPQALWRERILREFEGSVREVGFDGIHMDQYGFPKWAYDAAGNAVDVAACFPSLIDEAVLRVEAEREGAAVLFNAVNNWPLRQVVKTHQAAVYIEVWPPHDHYRDLVELVRRARDLSGKQVILAAYLEPFLEGDHPAEHAALLTTAVIACAGGHHLLLGEGNAVLRDAYYPNHGRLSDDFIAVMRRYYDHTAAHYDYLYPLDLDDVTTSYTSGINGEIVVTGADISTQPDGEAVWLTIRQRKNQFVLNLVNLSNTPPTWNKGKHRPESIRGLTLTLSSFASVRCVSWSSPDNTMLAQILDVTTESGKTYVSLPELSFWATVIIDIRYSASQ